MSSNLFNIPIDIPWKRLCFSQDMCAKSLNDYPQKWRSSIAIYNHDVELDPNDTTEERTMFLKVVISITGFQPEGPDIDKNIQRSVAWSSAALGLVNQLTKYYPAYAALLQVLVVPKGKKDDGSAWAQNEFPYIIGFEPKKRELIELATDTDEALTQSKDELNVRKGLSTSDSQENINIDHGISGQSSGEYGGMGGSMSGSLNYDRGTKNIKGTNLENIRTIDSSIDKRESYSHQSQISNLYHQLDSYHEGMNRVIFFHNARPHTQPAIYNTFVNGIRVMEGIQEHFLIVKRPKDMKEICVKGILETAHINEYTVTTQLPSSALQTKIFSKNFSLSAEGNTAGSLLGINSDSDEMIVNIPPGYKLDPAFGGKFITIYGDDPNGWQEPLYLPPGFELPEPEFDKNGNITKKDYRFDSNEHAVPVFEQISEDQWRVSMTVSGWAGAGTTDGTAKFLLTVHLIEIENPQSNTEKKLDLFLTGRSVSNCPDEVADNNIFADYITYEQSISDEIRDLYRHNKPNIPFPKGIAMSHIIRKNIMQSFKNGVRYKNNQVDFYHSNFIRSYINLKLPVNFHTKDVPLHRLEGMPMELREHFEKNEIQLTARDVLKYSPQKFAERVNLPLKESLKISRIILGIK